MWRRRSDFPHTTGSPITVVLGAVVRVATLLLTSVMIFTVWPTVKGPRALPLGSSGVLWVKSASTPPTCHLTSFVVAWLPPPGM